MIRYYLLIFNILFFACGEVGPDGKIFISFKTTGIDTLEVPGYEVICSDNCHLVGYITYDNEILNGYVLHHNDKINYSYTFNSEQTVGDFTISINKGGDPSGMDDGSAGIDKACQISIDCQSEVCLESMRCTEPYGDNPELCIIDDGNQVCTLE